MRKKWILAICLLIIVLSIVLVVRKNTYAIDSFTNFSREELEDFVVSTGISYFYNNTRSDYEQKTMDEKLTFNWRTFLQEPEMINRANKYFIDCSSFVASVYMHSLGYDFSEHYKRSESYVYWPTASDVNINGKIGAGKSKENFNIAYKYIGKGINTTFFANIGKYAYDQDNGNYINGNNEYIDNSFTKRDVVVYHYNVTGDENTTLKNAVKNTLTGDNKILRPGDLVIYRRGEADSGHVILYVGDVFDKEGGFVHATGKDYVFPSETEKISFGIDEYSIRYNSLELLVNNVFNTSTSTKGSSFTVLRPINNYCDGNNCQILTCDNSNCDIGYLNNNVKARVDLKELRVEQYAQVNKSYYDNLSLTGGDVTRTNNISKYNSVNVGDNITYSLYLLNKSSSGTVYDDLTITSKVPYNTVFVECTRECVYDQNKKEVMWIINENNKLVNERTYRYTVKVVLGDEIINEGIKIKTVNNNILQFSPIITKINPTINGINVELLKDEIGKFKKLEENNKITYESNVYSSYTKDLDDITSFSISQFGFIKMIYYNSLGIDIGYLKLSNMKDAIFNSDTIDDGYYVKKKNDEINLLVDENSININKMLVKGMYGGRLLKGNENLDRAKFLSGSDLEVGDIVVFFYENSNSISVSLFYGLDNDKNPIFVRFESDDGLTFYDANNDTKTGMEFFKEIYTKDLFMVLRPTQLYGTTVNYEYNGATTMSDTSYVAYDIYRNLVVPYKEEKTLTLVYNHENLGNETYSGNNKFDGWYSDVNLTNKVDNLTKLISTDTHKLYAKWDDESIILPNPDEINGYKIEGWYSDEDLTNKVGNGGNEYLIDENITLYAKWVNVENIVSDKFNIDLTNKIISNIELNMSFQELIEYINLDYYDIKFFDKDHNEIEKEEIIKTGDIIKIDDVEYKLSVLGDITGDGVANINDIIKLSKYIINNISFGGQEYINAGDIINDGEININDIIKISKYIIASNKKD